MIYSISSSKLRLAHKTLSEVEFEVTSQVTESFSPKSF